MKICVNTQTPPVRFNLDSPALTQKQVGLLQPLDLSFFAEGKDFQFTPGGVSRMVFPLLKLMETKGIIGDTHWVCLNSTGPEEVIANGITLHHVSLEAEKMKGYGYTKEVIWNTLHGTLQEST